MPGPRQPTDLIKANGRKHLSKAEEAERRSREVSVPAAKTAKPPKWLPEALKKEFRSLGKQLISAGLNTDLDADTLGRYLVAQHQWILATQEAEQALVRRGEPGAGPKQREADELKRAQDADLWGRIQERYFKQARNCASDMGLSVTARCRLVAPESARQKTEAKNPFLQLIEGGRRDA